MVLLADALGSLGIRPQPLGTTAPSSPATGQTWLDTTTTPPTLKVWTGSTWVSPTAGGGGGSTTAIGTTAPSSPITGQIWLDTTTTPPIQKIWTGNNWVIPSAGGLELPFKFSQIRFNQGSNSAKLQGALDFDGDTMETSNAISFPQSSPLITSNLDVNALQYTSPTVMMLTDTNQKWAVFQVNSISLGIILIGQLRTIQSGFSTSGSVSMLLA